MVTVEVQENFFIWYLVQFLNCLFNRHLAPFCGRVAGFASHGGLLNPGVGRHTRPTPRASDGASRDTLDTAKQPQAAWNSFRDAHVIVLAIRTRNRFLVSPVFRNGRQREGYCRP